MKATTRPITIRLKGRDDILHCTLDENPADEAETFTIWFVHKCLIKRGEDEPADPKARVSHSIAGGE